MSIKVSDWVWKHSRSRGVARLVLLAIADQAEDDGTNAWPSMPTLAAKTGKSQRTVQRHIRTLAELGELYVGYQCGGKPGMPPYKRPNRYTILMQLPGDNLSPGDTGDTGTGDTGDTTPVTALSPQRRSDRVTLVTPNPSSIRPSHIRGVSQVKPARQVAAAATNGGMMKMVYDKVKTEKPKPPPRTPEVAHEALAGMRGELIGKTGMHALGDQWTNAAKAIRKLPPPDIPGDDLDDS